MSVTPVLINRSAVITGVVMMAVGAVLAVGAVCCGVVMIAADAAPATVTAFEVVVYAAIAVLVGAALGYWGSNVAVRIRVVPRERLEYQTDNWWGSWVRVPRERIAGIAVARTNTGEGYIEVRCIVDTYGRYTALDVSRSGAREVARLLGVNYAIEDTVINERYT